MINNDSNDQKTLNVLSLDGGGIKGIAPARILQEIEERTGKSCSQLFNIASGTSTGGMIASLIAATDENGKAKFSAKDILEIYLNQGSKIFNKSFLRNIKTGFGIWGAKYSRSFLDKLLKEKLENQKLSQSPIDLFLTTYSIKDQKPIILNTADALKNSENDFYLSDAAGATSAAPTYFDPKILSNVNNSKILYAADGGIFANDHEIIAICNIYKKYKTTHNMRLLSLGTGNFSIDPNLVKYNNGLIGWIIKRNLIASLMDADEEFDHFLISEIFKFEHYRIQPQFKENKISLDNTSQKNMNLILSLTEKYIKENSKEIDQICKKLTS